MILENLVKELEQRFQHEKRARVCLWFDERGEFGRLLPHLETYLASLSKRPFVLLAYDADKRHGQLWLRHQIHQRRATVSASERERLNFVVYLPLAEERLDAHPGDDGPTLELLEEYRTIGVIFRIGGKRPTLFSFLKQAGVTLPENPSEQRRLYDGGRDSLLAKYTARFNDRPAVFWETRLTPEHAQSGLIGDVGQVLFELAADPDGTWRALADKGLDKELAQVVKEHYGFDGAKLGPSDWIRELVAQVALTETYLAYDEPKDFPFKTRLPPLPLRAHHKELAHRWLRDAEFRPAWDRWVVEAEASYSLSVWAKDRWGRSVAFPHLVLSRWGQLWEKFEAASATYSGTQDFLAEYRVQLKEHAEFSRATDRRLGSWSLLCELDAFVSASAEACRETVRRATASGLAELYVQNARRIEGAHVEIRAEAEDAGLAAVTRVVDRSYAQYTLGLNEAAFTQLAEAGTLDVLNIPRVTTSLQQSLWKAHGRRAVIIVDALRYDCALRIGEHLSGYAVETTPMLAMLPTITPIGMTALLPLEGATISVETKNTSIHPKVNGKDMAAREHRLAYLKAFGADCREITEIESTSKVPELGDLLVVFGHDEVDHIGHGEASTLIRHIRTEIERLARVIKRLHRWGYGQVHVVTDHGFLLLDEDKLPDEVNCDKSWCHVLKERFALVPATADLPLTTFPFDWEPGMRVAVPPGLAFFKAEKSFSHGGATLQELVIPHLVSKAEVAQTKRINIEVVLPVFELQRPAVKLTLRAAHAAGGSQMPLFGEAGRTISIDVLRRATDGNLASVLAGRPKAVQIEAQGDESVTLFFHSAQSFRAGELLELDIRDIETTEQFPPGGIKLTVGRDM